MNLSTLKNVWYMGMPSRDLKKSAMKSIVIMNNPILFYRDSKGQVFALRDICPHRGIPLSYGRLIDDQVECPYHGWKFDCTGSCTEIPSLVPGQDLDPKKIKVRSYPVIEQQGIIWVFYGDKDFPIEKAPTPPVLTALPMDAQPKILEIVTFPCHVDHAIIGLMDPAHGPYVHKSWFWRSSKSMIAKKKKFAPVNYGFQMVRHKPSANSKAYKIFGGERTTEITFTLPGVRVEHITMGEKSFYSFTGITPVSETETRIHQMCYWNIPMLNVLKPFVHEFAKVFLHQDMMAVTQQQDGLKFDPSLMLIKDADTQAKWYYALKQEWEDHLAQKREFKNPVQESILEWRS